MGYFLQIDIFHLLHKFRLKNLAAFCGKLFKNVGVHFSLQFQSKQTATVLPHIRTVHLDTIKVLFIHQLMH